MPRDQLEETEEYLKAVEHNMETSFKTIGRMIYKLFYMIAGALEPLINMFMPKEDNDDEPF